MPKPEKTKVKLVLIGCPPCGASGHVDSNKDGAFCPECKGGGRISVPEPASKPCPACGGTGDRNDMPCKPCAATGRIAGDEKAGELALAKQEKETAAANAELQAKLDESFEKGRQAAFREVSAGDTAPVQEQLASAEKKVKAQAREIEKLRRQLAKLNVQEEADEAAGK